ncbi:MAG TPA: type I polyketide synthase [Blastocatellia bacterium]|nr:type I polyketide synthase [Blastocatellia bacterium]
MPSHEPLAIIGIGCRFPGANGPQAFWSLLRDGVDAITEIPPGRFAVDSVYDPAPGKPGKIVNRAGGFLSDMDRFDAGFFGISPREALRMDPQQRLLLEVTWEALEDAGIIPDRLAGSDTGVFIGATTVDYEDIQYHLRDRTEIDFHVATGTARSVLSGRVSYTFDLLGPSLTVDTACSSSLVAAHLACESLWNGESDLAIAGGVNLVLLPELSMPFSRAKMLAADSRCRFADANAGGFTRSDGIGVVLLKRLSKAQADRDHIYAVILGGAVNNDGRGSGSLATPSREGQQAVLHKAYRNAGVSPSAVRYVEAHGTGTAIGDPIEVQSLGAVLGDGRRATDHCLLGSVKSNIGHTEGAAGIAGLIKAALCLEHRAVAPTLHFHTPNPSIPWRDLPLRLCRELTPLPAQDAIVGVSAFGISATNAHVVLREAPPAASCREGHTDGDGHARLLTLSSHTPAGLADMADTYRAYLANAEATLEDLCYSANVRKTHHSHRLAIVAHSRAELSGHLRTFLDQRAHPALAVGDTRTASGVSRPVFVFPGQGSQWLGMGRQLLRQEPVFADALARCEAAIRQQVGWSLIAELSAEPADSRLGEIDVVQPCLFAIQVGLAQLWRHWGIEPHAVVGQSMGEIAAAHVAGALRLEDATRIICRRSRLLKRMSGRGAMAVVGLSFEETQAALAGFEDRLSIAVSSSPTSTVIAGEPAALQQRLDTLKRAGVFCQPVKVDVASHSPQMDLLRADLLEALAGIEPRPATIPLYSTVTGGPAHGLMLDADYWAANLRQPVLLSKAAQALLADGYDTFIEISPHPLLSGPLQQAAQHSQRQALMLASLRRDENERAVMLASLGALYAAGREVSWEHLHADGGRFVQPPLYAWQAERYWLSPDDSQARRSSAVMAADCLLPDRGLCSAADRGTRFWEFDLSSAGLPYLKDHCVQGAVVLPAAAYLEMALTAAQALFAGRQAVLEQVDFKKALILSDLPLRVQFVTSQQGPERATFEVYSLANAEDPDSWVLHAAGAMSVAQTEAAPPPTAIESIRARCDCVLSQDVHYRMLAQRGLQYGPCFRGVKQLWRGRRIALADIALPGPAGAKADNYQVHPALLDSCFQALAATLPLDKTDVFLPVGLEKLQVYQRPCGNVWAYAVLEDGAAEGAEVLKGDLVVLDEQGQPVLRATGLGMKRLDKRPQETDEQQAIERLLYDLQWQPGEPLRPARPATPGVWVIFTDDGVASARLLRALEDDGDRCVKVIAGSAYAEHGPDHYEIDAASLADYTRLLAAVFGSSDRPVRGIVHLWSLDPTVAGELSSESLGTAGRLGWGSAFLLVKALAEAGPPQGLRLCLVTRQAQSVTGNESLSLAQSPLWGLGKVVTQEHPEVCCSLLDLGAASEQEMESLALELRATSVEAQVALRGGSRYVGRLARHSLARLNEPLQVEAATGQAFGLKINRPGDLDALGWHETARRDPGPGEVEIEVQAVGLNFRDVMLALGALPSDQPEDFGWECAGRVARVGAGVDGFKTGDEVLAIAHPCFTSYATIPACLALAKPAHLSFEEAATVPLALLTAYYSLIHLGRLRKGERVLIHSASGGVGLAAVRLAQQRGAEIFATAGSESRRAFLRSLGVEQVFDSRSLRFADEIRRATHGEGVDLVLNSLTGEAISASLSLLRSGGRFLELGRQDIYKNAKLGLAPFRKNLSFSAIDLACLIRESPAYAGSLLREAMNSGAVNSGSLPPLETFPVGAVADGFRMMANARHTGKIAFRLGGERVQVASAPDEAFQLHADGTYLITGGLGGLGLSVAGWMVGRGARHLVLVGRTSGSRSAQEAVAALRKTAEVVVAQADVSDREQLRAVLSDLNQRMPALRGVVHAAGSLDDGILLQLDAARFNRVMAPKVAGAWNLHTLTMDARLDFFILFSSVASLLGSAGQGNYAAANAFLDCLAHYRRSKGLAALSVNWGPWSEVGLAAEGDRLERLAARGIGGLTPRQGVKVFERLLACCSAGQVAVMDFDSEQWRRSGPQSHGLAALAGLASDPRGACNGLELSRERLLAAEAPERQELLESYLNALLARVLGFDQARPTRLDVNQPINHFGLDSLMALEVKTRIEANLGIRLPIVEFIKGASIAQLVTRGLEQLPAPAAPARPRMASAAAGATQPWEELSI